MRFRRIEVGGCVGAITGFVERNNIFYGLSAYHVLSGNDRQINPYEDIAYYYDSSNKNWKMFGHTYSGIFCQGNNESGYLDYALIDIIPNIRDNIRVDLIRNNVITYNNILIGMPVKSYSVINEGDIFGIISGKNVKGFDLSISLNGTTHRGDSGLLWKDNYGNAISMHLRGNRADYADISYGSLLSRILNENDTFYTFAENQII